MKRLLTLLLICMLFSALGCAKKAEPAPAPAVTAPAPTELTLRLPLGARNDVAKTFPAYTAGFSAANGDPLSFSAASADPVVAEGILREDGTLYVIAHGTGETKITVTAKTPSGEYASSVISVKVRDARRILALLAIGLLAVAILILLGKPAQKKPDIPAPIEKPDAAETPDAVEPPDSVGGSDFPVAIFIDEEEPNDNPERS